MTPDSRRRGRPSLGDRVETRLTREVREALARWAEERPDIDRRDGQPAEADAIRMIVEERLSTDGFL